MRASSSSLASVLRDIHDARFAQGMLDEDESPEDLVTVRTRVDVVEPMGSEVYLYLLHGRDSIVSRVDDRTEVQPNYVIDMAFNMDKMHALILRPPSQSLTSPRSR